MINCPYCGAENEDGEEFCESCGKPLVKKDKTENKIIENAVSDTTVYSDQQIPVYENVADVVFFPTVQLYKNGRYELQYAEPTGINLEQYLKDNSLTDNELFKIELSILDLFEYIESHGYIVGSCNLKELYIDAADNRSFLKITRPMLKNGYIPENYIPGEHAAPEVKNGNEENVGNRTDVYLAAIIFARIMIREKYVQSSVDSQLFWAFTLSNGAFSKTFRSIHYWLGQSLSMYPSKRINKVKSQRIKFEKCITLLQSGFERGLRPTSALETNIGKGKMELMKQNGRAEEEWNEDVIDSWISEDGKMAAYLLADGISNCNVGSGFMASNIVRDNFKKIFSSEWSQDLDDLAIEDIEGFIYQIIENSNRDIYQKALEITDNPTGIMGSTFIIVLIYNGGMYTYSLGDSKLYLIRNENVIPLNSPDNVGLDRLKHGMSYEEYRRLEDRASIFSYIGGDFYARDRDYFRRKEVDALTLKAKDVIVVMSDGVLDYLGKSISDTEWDKERELVSAIKSESKTLEMKAKSIIKKDNTNGGGDNLSIILIEMEEENGNE